MKKHIKLLLLGLLFTLIGIFNFSSAWESTVYCDKDTSGCGITNQSVCCSVPKLTSFTCTSVGTINVLRLSSDGSTVGSTNFTCPGVYVTSNPSRLVVGYGGNGVTSGFYVTDTNVMPVSEFTPIITLLTTSVNEFIPYVAYVGIGLLVAVIGFVSIKRLINWVRVKIFSSFKR